MANPPRWQRIYKQTLILMYKNFLLFYGALLSTTVRAVIFPIVFTVIMCVLKNINAAAPYDLSPDRGVIAPEPTPIQDLDVAIKSSSSNRLVFVRNGVSDDLVNPIINGIMQKPTLKEFDIQATDDANDLFDLCPQNLWGISNCFAAIIFSAFNDTDVEYSIALDGQLLSDSDSFSTDYQHSLLSTRILPLQWEIDSQIGNLPPSSKPSENPWAGYFYTDIVQPTNDGEPPHGPVWLALIGMFIAPFFILIHLGVAYHLGVFVAKERETSISQLMNAQMVTDTPRIISNVLSFLALYFPGMLVSSILLTQLLFIKTSDILFLFLTLLAGVSIIVSSHFLASFFGKSQLAGLYISTFVFALALVSLAATLLSSSPYSEIISGSISKPTTNIQVLVLSLLFPPYTWATLIGDVANREFELSALTLSSVTPTLEELQLGIPPQEALKGYFYIVFFVVQIIFYSAATYFIERRLWGVKRPFDFIPESSDVALRCTHLSKTYYGNRPWYWPFVRKGAPNLAVQNLDLEVKKGSVTFLLGPNGGGKTTALKCVSGMTAMDPGSRLEINEAGTVFGICPQHNVFWEDLTVEQHIKIWKKLKTAAFQDTSTSEDNVLEECDLEEKANAKAKTLSGGQKRKLQLAICFTGGSSVCCVDEASSGLDPLSRRNIWNIIQKGHSRRTVLVTTHFLDEADVLADHIAIIYKGKLVCEGPSTSLKSRYGGSYVIRSEPTEGDDAIVWTASTSLDATRKLIELEGLTNENLRVIFPTLENVFLNVTDSSTRVHENLGDGAVGEEEDAGIDEKAFALEVGNARDIDLDVGHSIGIARQVITLFRKRYTLLLQRAGWISYGINLIIPVIIGAVLAHYVPRLPTLQTCQDNVNILLTQSLQQGSDLAPLTSTYSQYITSGIVISGQSTPAALLGPPSAFSGPVQDDLYLTEIGPYIMTGYSDYPQPQSGSNTTQILDTRQFVNDTSSIIAVITNSSYYGFYGIGIWAPTPATAIIFHDSESYNSEVHMHSFSLITNRIANATSTGRARVSSAHLRFFAHVESNVSFWSMPIAIILVLAFIAAASIAVIYPSFERVNHVRALHYCNGVSPFALWFGYLLFDMQIIIIQSFIIWGVAFAGPLERLYYASGNILGVLILFGMATYLGTYFLSLFIKKAAFAIAAGIHLLLFILYLVGYIINQAVGNVATRHQTYSLLQYFVGLTSPAANLARALFLSMNVFGVLCGEFGNDESKPMAYHRFGSVYTNLLVQIAFLITMLVIYEYGSADWFRRHVTHRGVPARLHYLVDSGQMQDEKHARAAVAVADPTKILSVSHVTKFFGRNFAALNISFDIAPNETLALLGGNGAGKTTMINLIRGELRPNFGNITVDGISVLRQPHKAKTHMGVCPQDDAVDNLTVRQTLSFYASVKGLKNIPGNVDKVLHALNITTYEHLLVKALSGGTKRKLSVAIALLGNPRILLLDEPSTGQDAGAKRILWRALQEISSDRAILLTTHSMEEAEALATNVAIMGTKMLATGTLNSLQEEYGSLYTIRAVRVPGITREEVESLVRESFGEQVVNYEDRHGQVSFNLPHDKAALGRILKALELLKGHAVEEQAVRTGGGSSNLSDIKVLEDYTLTPPTLEEVFMQVAREAGSAEGV